MEKIPVFGTILPGVTYEARPGSYAFLANTEGKLAIIHTSYGYFLPGGGLDPGESDEDGLKRELMEEIGYRVSAAKFLFRASQYHWSEHYQKHFQKIGAFFSVQAGPIDGAREQAGHTLLWMPLVEAKLKLSQEFQRWALARAK